MGIGIIRAETKVKGREHRSHEKTENEKQLPDARIGTGEAG